jgi:hypothetical protein
MSAPVCRCAPTSGALDIAAMIQLIPQLKILLAINPRRFP